MAPDPFRAELDKIWDKLGSLELDAARASEAAKGTKSQLDSISVQLSGLTTTIQTLSIAMAQANGALKFGMLIAALLAGAGGFIAEHFWPK